MAAMLPVFYGEVPEVPSAASRSRPSDSGSSSGLASVVTGGGKAVKKRRVLTEARKEQNREAQRLFRQRQRERRQKQDLEAAIPGKPRELRPLVKQKPSDTSVTCASREETSSSSATPDSSGSSPLDEVAGDEEIVDIQIIPHSEVAAALRASVPDLMANTLEFLPTTVFGACLHNALALGVDLKDLATCGPEGLSPFYRPSSPADDPAALFSCAMLSLSRKPPPSLLPTLTQILIPHHPSLDLIPLPHFRDQAITLSASMPQVYNMWELKLDIYQRGGLVMLKRRQGSDGKTRSCRPWEKSSWVAQPWFLRKWSMVVVGERDQLSRAVPSDADEGGAVYQRLLSGAN